MRASRRATRRPLHRGAAQAYPADELLEHVGRLHLAVSAVFQARRIKATKLFGACAGDLSHTISVPFALYGMGGTLSMEDMNKVVAAVLRFLRNAAPRLSFRVLVGDGESCNAGMWERADGLPTTLQQISARPLAPSRAERFYEALGRDRGWSERALSDASGMSG